MFESRPNKTPLFLDPEALQTYYKDFTSNALLTSLTSTLDRLELACEVLHRDTTITKNAWLYPEKSAFLQQLKYLCNLLDNHRWCDKHFSSSVLLSDNCLITAERVERNVQRIVQELKAGFDSVGQWNTVSKALRWKCASLVAKLELQVRDIGLMNFTVYTLANVKSAPQGPTAALVHREQNFELLRGYITQRNSCREKVVKLQKLHQEAQAKEASEFTARFAASDHRVPENVDDTGSEDGTDTGIMTPSEASFEHIEDIRMLSILEEAIPNINNNIYIPNSVQEAKSASSTINTEASNTDYEALITHLTTLDYSRLQSFIASSLVSHYTTTGPEADTILSNRRRLELLNAELEAENRQLETMKSIGQCLASFMVLCVLVFVLYLQIQALLWLLR